MYCIRKIYLFIVFDPRFKLQYFKQAGCLSVKLTKLNVKPPQPESSKVVDMLWSVCSSASQSANVN